MASSFTEYNGNGFWSRDEVLTTSAAYIYREMVKYNKVYNQSWLTEMAEDFRLKSYSLFVGFTILLLDEFLTNEERRTAMLDILLSTHNALVAKEEMIDMSELNEDVDDDGQKIWSDRFILKERLINTVDYIIKIIKGESVAMEPHF